MNRQHWRAVLRRHSIHPDRNLGQNFLVEPAALEKVVRAAGLSGSEVVLEIGAGLGALTRRLAEEAKSVVAVEFDRRIIPALEESVGDLDNVTVIVADALRLDLRETMGGQDYSVVANIPYNITSALIRKLMEADHRPREVILTIQKEVAERITAEAGDMSLLALSVQLYGRPVLKAEIPRDSFYPSPDVDSAVLFIDVDPNVTYSRAELDGIFELAKAGFGQRRKQLRNSLSSGLGVPKASVASWLASAGLGRKSRAQELSVEQWRRLARAVNSDSEGQSG